MVFSFQGFNPFSCTGEMPTWGTDVTRSGRHMRFRFLCFFEQLVLYASLSFAAAVALPSPVA